MTADLQVLRERARTARQLKNAEAELHQAEQEQEELQRQAARAQRINQAGADFSELKERYAEALEKSNLELADLVETFSSVLTGRRNVGLLADELLKLARVMSENKVRGISGITAESSNADLSDALRGLAQQKLIDDGLWPTMRYRGDGSRETNVVARALNVFGELVRLPDD